MLLKIIGIILILLSSAALGLELRYALERKLRSARALEKLLVHTRQMIKSLCASGGDILSSCPSELLFDCGYIGECMPKSFSELADRCRIEDRECSRIFCEFCRDFGKSYREEELGRCERYLALLSARVDCLQSEIMAKKKTALVLPLSCGLILAILFA